MDKPLVSVVLITYNLSKYVIDALESVKNQTYSNLELIITDDCSSDDTVQLCKDWVDLNVSRFKRVKIVTSCKNTGIALNRNRGCFESRGEWIKQIDGDDRLKPNCIEDYVKFVVLNPSKNIVFSPLEPFGDENLEKWNHLTQTNFKYIFSLSDKQFKILLCKISLFPAPSVFIKRTFFEEVGGYDEKMAFCDDWPFWLSIAFNGANFAYILTPEVEYRISPVSFSQAVNGNNGKFIDSKKKAKKKILHYMKKISILYFIDGVLAYKKEYSSSFIWKFIVYLRPINPYFWIARRLYKKYFSIS